MLLAPCPMPLNHIHKTSLNFIKNQYPEQDNTNGKDGTVPECKPRKCPLPEEAVPEGFHYGRKRVGLNKPHIFFIAAFHYR